MSLSRPTRQALQVLVVLGLAVLLAPTVYWHTRPILRLYVWDGYFPQSVLTQFELENRVRVQLYTYSSNEEMLARVKVSWDEFDVIMPSNYVVDQMRRYHLLRRMDDEEVPNIHNLSPDYRNGRVVPPGEEYFAVPYLGNYAGIGYSKKWVPHPPTTWKEFFSATTAATYGPRLSLLAEPRETIGLALLALGHSPNSRDPGELQEVRQMLEEQTAAGAPSFVLEDGRDMLLQHKTEILATWSPEINLAEGSNPEIGYIMPADGSILTVDTLAIPSSSSRQELAVKFINYLMQPEIARRVTEYSLYANSLRADLNAAPPDLSGTPSSAVPPTGKSYVLSDVGDAQYLYDTIWAEYQARQGRP